MAKYTISPEMVIKAQKGDQESISMLYELTVKDKYYIALKYMRSREEAENVVQEAFIKAFSNLNKLKDPSTFSSWLGMIVANTAKNALVKKNPMLFSNMVPDDEAAGGEQAAEEPLFKIEDKYADSRPEEAYSETERGAMIDSLLDALTDEQRLSFLMFYMEELSIREIAGALDTNENTIKSLLFEGRNNLDAKAGEMNRKGYISGIEPFPLLVLLLKKDMRVYSADTMIAGETTVLKPRNAERREVQGEVKREAQWSTERKVQYHAEQTPYDSAKYMAGHTDGIDARAADMNAGAVRTVSKGTGKAAINGKVLGLIIAAAAAAGIIGGVFAYNAAKKSADPGADKTAVSAEQDAGNNGGPSEDASGKEKSDNAQSKADALKAEEKDTIAAAAENETPKEYPAWNKAYAEYLRTTEEPYDTCSFIYLNDDEVPEMVLKGNGDYKQMIFTYADDAVQRLSGTGSSEELTYIPGKSIAMIGERNYYFFRNDDITDYYYSLTVGSDPGEESKCVKGSELKGEEETPLLGPNAALTLEEALKKVIGDSSALSASENEIKAADVRSDASKEQAETADIPADELEVRIEAAAVNTDKADAADPEAHELADEARALFERWAAGEIIAREDSPEQIEAALQNYHAFLTEHSGDYKAYSLIYLDDDMIPELACGIGMDHASGWDIFTFDPYTQSIKDICQTGNTGYMQYIERCGIIVSSDAHTGTEYERIEYYDGNAIAEAFCVYSDSVNSYRDTFKANTTIENMWENSVEIAESTFTSLSELLSGFRNDLQGSKFLSVGDEVDISEADKLLTSPDEILADDSKEPRNLDMNAKINELKTMWNLIIASGEKPVKPTTYSTDIYTFTMPDIWKEDVEVVIQHDEYSLDEKIMKFMCHGYSLASLSVESASEELTMGDPSGGNVWYTEVNGNRILLNCAYYTSMIPYAERSGYEGLENLEESEKEKIIYLQSGGRTNLAQAREEYMSDANNSSIAVSSFMKEVIAPCVSVNG